MRVHSAVKLVRATAIVLILVGTADAKAVWYVNAAAAGNGSGTSWANAFTTFEAGLAAASATVDAQGNSDEIWVVTGTYYTPLVGGAIAPFAVTKPLKIYGGFAGGETSIQTRHGSFLNTILDGDYYQTPNQSNDDALHVINMGPATGTMSVTIDGFRIQHSYATGAGVHGGGVLSANTNLSIANCFFRSNRAPTANNNGGGLHFTNGTLHIANTEFQDNTGYHGGGIYATSVTGEIVNTSFYANISVPDGAGVYLTNTGSGNRLDFTNCVFSWNSATGSTGCANQGAGLYLADAGSSGTGSSAQLANCTFADNVGGSYTNGQALNVSTYSQATIYNSILWFNGDLSGTVDPINGSPTVAYSDAQNWSGGGSGNINSDPLFTNHGIGRLTLASNSPCLDAADYSQVPLDTLDVDGDGNTGEVLPVDFGFNARLADQGSITDTGAGGHGCSSCTYLDMGAYERP